MPPWRGCDLVSSLGCRVDGGTARALWPGQESSARHAGGGHSGGLGGPTPAAGRNKPQVRPRVADFARALADTGQLGVLVWTGADVAVARPKAFNVTSGLRS